MSKYYKFKCKCGCEGKILIRESHKKNGIPEFISGHNPHGIKTRFKNGEKATNWNGFKEGNIPWNKDGYHSPESCKKMSISHLGTHLSESTKLKLSKINSGENHPRYIDGYAHERGNSVRTGKGFIPLNHKTKIANTMHHLEGDEYVIFEPKELHDACYHGHHHNHGESRQIADEIAYNWLWEELEHDYNLRHKIKE